MKLVGEWTVQMARRFCVVVNECAAPAHSNSRSVNFRKTANNDPNLRLSAENIVAHLPRELTGVEMDWFELLGSIYATDLACARGDGDTDWGRDIELHLPLRDPSVFAPHTIALQEVFADLTSDRLRLHLHEDPDPLPSPKYSKAWTEYDSVALLSGGVDSYVGAVKLMHAGRKPIMISHGSGAITTPQQSVRKALKEQFGAPPPFARLTAETVRERFPADREESQRARSLLFMGAALLVAEVLDVEEIWLNENGVMAVHVPLTLARMGSLSTKTAYPPIVERVADIASHVLGRRLHIRNNLLELTKPEVVATAVELGVAAKLRDTASCWSWHRDREHCGVCIPCMTRRISFELHGVLDARPTADPFDDERAIDRPFARDNLVHLCMVVQEIGELDDLQFELKHPEILDGGTQITPAQVRALYRRWAEQALEVLSRHPVPQGLTGV